LLSLERIVMKTLWSASVPLLLLIVALVFLEVAFSSAHPPFTKIGAVALGLVFLATAINTSHVHHPLADKLVTILHVCAGCLVIAALVPGAASVIR
jgi:hypothetical protein